MRLVLLVIGAALSIHLVLAGLLYVSFNAFFTVADASGWFVDTEDW